MNSTTQEEKAEGKEKKSCQKVRKRDGDFFLKNCKSEGEMEKCVLCPGRNVIPTESKREKWQDHADGEGQKNGDGVPVCTLLRRKREDGAKGRSRACSGGDAEHPSKK